jgi:hypothetical protein
LLNENQKQPVLGFHSTINNQKSTIPPYNVTSICNASTMPLSAPCAASRFCCISVISWRSD